MKNNIHKILLATLPFMAINANAATPQSFNYQSVVRTSNGAVIANQIVFIKVEIMKEELGSLQVVYSEMHHATTNLNGSFAIKIGEGSSQTGKFSDIDWSENKYIVRTSTSTNSDMSDAVSVRSDLSSVPYALYALKSADSFSGRWADLTGKPNMSDYAKVEDVASYAADSTFKILSEYATKDDVTDLYNRGLRSSNYRIDSLKSVINANQYYISELQADAAKYATKSEISSFAKKDTLSSYATKASLNTLSKTTSEKISELSQTVSTNKALAEANLKDVKEIQKLYAKKDTLEFYMKKTEMSVYATKDAVNTLDNNVISLSKSINSTDTRLSELTNSVSDLSEKVTSNKKDADQKYESNLAQFKKIEDQIASTERKAKADDLVLENRISANEKNISTLTNASAQLVTKYTTEFNELSATVAKNDKMHSASIDSLAKVTTSIANAATKNTNRKVDSLANAVSNDLQALGSSFESQLTEKVTALNNADEEMQSSIENVSSKASTNSTKISNINSTMNQVVNWAAKIDSVQKAQIAKYKADSLKMEKRIKDDSLKVVAKYNEMKQKYEQFENQLGGKTLDEYVNSKIASTLSTIMATLGITDINTYVDDKISAKLTAEGLDGISTTVNNLDNTVNDASTGLVKKVATLTTDLNTLKDDVNGTNGLKSDVTTLKSDVNNLKTTVGDASTGLVKDVDDLETTINTTSTGLKDRVGALESAASSLPDIASGVNTRITNLENTVGSDASGLVKKVNDLDSKVSTLHP